MEVPVLVFPDVRPYFEDPTIESDFKISKKENKKKNNAIMDVPFNLRSSWTEKLFI